MSKHLLRDLDNLQRQVLIMAGTVENSIRNAVRCILERDPGLASGSIVDDDDIDDLDNDLAEECLRILALHQPVARDLRRIATIMTIKTDLERMADLAVDIVQRIDVLARPPFLVIPERLPKMAEAAIWMVRQSMDAFVQMDDKLARKVIRLDDEVDRYNVELIDELQQIMYSSKELIAPALSLFSVVRHLERIADHATNIAEDVLFLIHGEIVRHRPEKIADD